MEGDRRITLTEIAEEVDISYGSAQQIMRVDLGFHKVSARWVPRLLSDEHKRHRLEVYQLS
ncbi:hypothetical protein NQ318_001162 [Aromia moschata]|uniref:Uncharacterized protein n=1 Tax=Aromia moschata TaxID=1265417 RepID=A0AAV8ZEL8_9CUCU|nr:hypothetical protein NQ318_001162 [Aromia moschata]